MDDGRGKGEDNTYDYDGKAVHAAPWGRSVAIYLVTCAWCGTQIILKRGSTRKPKWWLDYGWSRLDRGGSVHGHKGQLYCPTCAVAKRLERWNELDRVEKEEKGENQDAQDDTQYTDGDGRGERGDGPGPGGGLPGPEAISQVRAGDDAGANQADG